MDSILFLDNYNVHPYDSEVFKQRSIAGTSCAIIRIAEKLGEFTEVFVAQHNRSSTDRYENVVYCPFSPDFAYRKWKAIVVLRNPQLALYVRETIKEAPIWLWMHDLINYKMLPYLDLLVKNNIKLIVVSKYHKKMLLGIPTLFDPLLPALPYSEVIYNPIADDLKADNTQVNPYKLMYASSPHKGLRYTLESFKVLKKQHPKFELFVANPGYMSFQEESISGVSYLGGIPYHQVIQHLRESLCLYYPNHAFPETFGLVFADANAVGTPVITHPLGSAVEVLQDERQLVNTYNLPALIEQVVSWSQGERPQVSVHEHFRISHVIQRWKEILGITT